MSASRSGSESSILHEECGFRFEGRAVFAGIEPPHTHVIVFEREF
jgi:hypothetical protein